MQLFKRLFRWHTGVAELQEAGTVAGPLAAPERKKSIQDMFRINLHNIPLATFTEGKAEVLANGDLVQTYCKTLDDKECGIFDTVCLKIIGSRSINIVFKSACPSGIGMDQISKVIDDLYDIYGNDSNNKGMYGHDDAVEYSDKHFYVLFGRDWMDYPRYEYPVTIRRYSDEVFISIWGLTHDNIVY